MTIKVMNVTVLFLALFSMDIVLTPSTLFAQWPDRSKDRAGLASDNKVSWLLLGGVIVVGGLLYLNARARDEKPVENEPKEELEAEGSAENAVPKDILSAVTILGSSSRRLSIGPSLGIVDGSPRFHGKDKARYFVNMKAKIGLAIEF